MNSADNSRIGYVVKVYPRYSETFIVNEILAHERAGLRLDIFSLRAPSDGLFHESLSRVQARVTYLPDESLKLIAFWESLGKAADLLPDLWAVLPEMLQEKAQDVYQAVALACAVQTQGITHLHAHFGTSAATVARLAARMAHVPYSFTAHAKDIFHESVRRDDLSRKLRDAAFTVTVSRYNDHFLRGEYPDSTGGLVCIYNGLDLSEYPFQEPAFRPARLIAVGRLVEKKGFTYLVDACKILAESGLDFHLDIVGGGEEEATLRAQVAQLHMEPFITFHGARPQSEVKRFIQGASAIAIPSIIGQDGNREGLPTVLLEAMALGTPCVATDVTGIPEILHHEQTGLMVGQRDALELADALRRLIVDGDLRVRLAHAARRAVEERFEINRNTAQMRALFTAAMREPAFALEAV